MKITLKDIASALGMNESTVSYALANKGSIKAETRERILRTAEKMGYVPNRSAQQISTGKSNLIGLVVPNVLFELGEYCEHIFRLLSDAGYLTSIMVTEFSPERERSIFRNLIGQGAAGIIVCPTAQNASSSDTESPLHLARLNGVPVICRNIDPQENCVMPDYRAIGSLLGKKLRKCGHRKIALMIPHSAPFPDFASELLKGVAETLGRGASVRMETLSPVSVPLPDGPFPPNPHYELQIRSMLAAGYIEATEELFRQVWNNSPQNRPDAMICFSENTALGLIAAARKCGVEIPRDLSLVTTQHTLFGNFLPTPVTAAYVPPLEFAGKTVKLLLKKIRQNSNQVEQLFLKPEFFPGGTLTPQQKETK